MHNLILVSSIHSWNFIREGGQPLSDVACQTCLHEKQKDIQITEIPGPDDWTIRQR